MENEIKVYLNSAYLKKVFLANIIGIPILIFMFFCSFRGVSIGLDYTLGLRISSIACLIIFVIVTICLLTQYFSKKPMLIANEKGIYKGNVFFLLTKEEGVHYNWNNISGISFAEEITITLNDKDETKVVLFCNENEDVPVIRNQILSKFRNEIEIFNIEIIQK
ncbi:MAG: hypothetical protein R3Y09_12395 [Clostridia bacterium]